MWRSEDEARQSTYDCSYCKMRNLKGTRVCYRFDSINTLNIPLIFDKAGNPKFHDEQGREIEGAYSQRKCDREEAINVLAEIAKKQPSRSVFDIWKSYFIRYIGTRWDEESEKWVSAEVCPIGLITEESESFISMEASASKYNSLPFEGSWLDQPQFIIEAFEAVAIGNGHFERDRMNKMKRESNKLKNK